MILIVLQMIHRSKLYIKIQYEVQYEVQYELHTFSIIH
jgi:hypothetical protein